MAQQDLARQNLTRQNLRRDITIVLTIKLLVVLAAAFFVFSPSQRPHVDSDSARAQILGQIPSLDRSSQ